MAIGRPISLTDNVASKIVSATATANQQVFTVTGGYRINAISVYRNGSRLNNQNDYTASDGSIVTLTEGASVGDVLEFQIFDDFRVADAIVSVGDQTISGNLTIDGNIQAANVTATSAMSGASIGIQSNYSYNVGTAKTLNFVGTAVTGDVTDSGTVTISIGAAAGGGGVGPAIDYDSGSTSPFTCVDKNRDITESITFNTSNAGVSSSYVVSVIPTLTTPSGVEVSVGAGKTLVVDVLQLRNLDLA